MTRVRSPAEANNFSSSLCVQTASGAHPASCTMGTGGSFPGDKARPGRVAGRSPHLVPRSISRSYTSSPPSAFVVCSGTAFQFFGFVFVRRNLTYRTALHKTLPTANTSCNPERLLPVLLLLSYSVIPCQTGQAMLNASGIIANNLDAK
jgi:hypothetical protein